MTRLSCSPALTGTVAAIVLLGLAMPASAQLTADALKRMSLEDMMDIEVSTVARTPQRVEDIPAAIHVVTRDDIRRSGATSLPEALRLAPGVHVARIDSTRYAIGIRGFGDRLARSMLVMIDGRAVYSPLFAGTYWEVQDAMLEDIERIEVIRGPGGTLWGANAVNGIINIVTRHSRDTLGTVVGGAVGDGLRGLASARFGDSTSDAFSYRVYGKMSARSPEKHADNAEFDESRFLQVGARTDWAAGPQSLTVQGDIYSARLGQRTALLTDTPPYSRTETRQAPLAGGNLLARWARTGGNGRGIQLRAYYDRTSRDERPVAETRDTIDVDFQQTGNASTRHALVWGLGYRRSSGRIVAMAPAAFTPDNRGDNLFSAFVQDEVRLVGSRLRAVAGIKLERNDYTGLELQPSARLIWHVTSDDTLIGSVTRAVRTPSRVETDYTTTSVTDAATSTFVRLLPNADFRAEELIAYEVGYRTQAARNTYVTVSSFFNQLDHMLSTELLPTVVEPLPTPRVVLPVTFRNGIEGQSHGFEVTADWRPLSWWRWSSHYAYARVQVSKKPGSTDASQERRYEQLVPRHQIYLHSSVDLPGTVEVDWSLRHVSRLPFGPVPAYTTSDVRVAWHTTPGFELAFVGQNLPQRAHREWVGPPNIELQRSAYFSLTWRR